MARKPKRESDRSMDEFTGEVDKDIVDDEVKAEFEDLQGLTYGRNDRTRRLESDTATAPELSGGDVDADWGRGEAVGEEGVGGSAPTPDQDVVDELGAAVGITYQDEEPLGTADKLNERDRHRWELDPASSEDYEQRIRQEFTEPPDRREVEE